MRDDQSSGSLSGADPPVEAGETAARSDQVLNHDRLGRAAGYLAENGVSATLAGLFTGLADQTTRDGCARFPRDTVAALRRAVLCRTWAPLTLEIGHWFEVLARGSPDETHVVLRAVYVEEAHSAQRFRHSVEQGQLALPCGARLESNKLYCGSGQDDFCLHLNRLPLWLALLELLVYVDPTLVSEVAPDTGAVEWARRLQKTFNNFLAQHLQPSRWQQRAYGVLKWLAEQTPARMPEAAIDDQRIVQFWQHADPDDDYRRFRSVAEVFLYLQQALIAGECSRAAEQAVAIDQMHEWLAVDPVWAESLDENSLDGNRLTKQPKFLTMRVWRSCEVLVVHRAVIDRLPMTLLRMQIFGDHQARIIEADKRGRKFDWGSLTRDGFKEWLEALVIHRATIRQAALAGIEALSRQGCVPEASALLLDWYPGVLSGGPADSVLPDALEAMTLYDLKALRLQLPALNQALEDCRKAFQAVNRAGFRGEDDFSEVSEYALGTAALHAIDGVLARFVDRVERAEPNYATDLAIFQDRFQKLHGTEA